MSEGSGKASLKTSRMACLCASFFGLMSLNTNSANASDGVDQFTIMSRACDEARSVTPSTPTAARKKVFERLLAIANDASKLRQFALPDQLFIQAWTADQALTLGQPETAEKILGRLSSKDPRVLALLARALIIQKKFEPAIKVTTEGLEQRTTPEQRADFFCLRAQSKRCIGRVDDSFPDFHRALSILPRDDFVTGVCFAYLAKNQVEKAASLLDQRKLKLEPPVPMIYLEIAGQYKGLSNWSKAEEYIFKAFSPAAQAQVRSLLSADSRSSGGESREKIDETKREPGTDGLLAELGRLYCARHKFDDARKYFSKITPTVSTPTLTIVTISEHLGGLMDLAEKHAQMLMNRQDDPNAFLPAAEVMMKIGKFDLALICLDRAAQNPPTREKALLHKGKLLLARGADEKVALIVRELQESYPEKHYSAASLKWGMSRSFVANFQDMERVRARLVKDELANLERRLSAATNSDEQARVLLDIAKCQLLAKNSVECLKSISELNRLGVHSDDVVLLKAAAMELGGDADSAEKERDTVVQKFASSNLNPVKLRGTNEEAHK